MVDSCVILMYRKRGEYNRTKNDDKLKKNPRSGNTEFVFEPCVRFQHYNPFNDSQTAIL